MLYTGSASNQGQRNDDSCVVRVSDGQNAALLAGDISSRTEYALPPNVRSQVLIAPHHGSKSSSSSLFIARVQPQHVVFSNGFFNRWNMPSEEIKARYLAYDVTLLSTAIDGQISFYFYPDDYKVARYHTEISPFWFKSLVTP